MLQIDHIYEFFFKNVFPKSEGYYRPNGVVTKDNINVFNRNSSNSKILFYDQEPFLNEVEDLLSWFKTPEPLTRITIFEDLRYPKFKEYSLDELYNLYFNDPNTDKTANHPDVHATTLAYPNNFFKEPHIIVVSEISEYLQTLLKNYELNTLYYFFHGFAALDWYRGHYALNFDKSIVKSYDYDFISFNRIINYDRSYRIYLISLLKAQGLLDKGLVSFNVTNNVLDDWRDEVADPYSKLSEVAKQHAETHLVDIDKLVIDRAELPGSASADIPRGNDALWNIVTETVFYYDKLHLTEKIFKPIVSKQPFMLVAAPGNLAYLRSYGFKTFDGIIDESYDLIQDNDQRTAAVVDQLAWYCCLSEDEKLDVIKRIEPIVLHNFHHFYGEFRHIITQELITNAKTLFKDLGYDDHHIKYNDIYHVLTH